MTASALIGEPQRGLSELAGVEHFVAPGTVDFVRGIMLRWSDPPRIPEAAEAFRRSAASPHHWWNVRAVCWLCLANYNLSMMNLAGAPKTGEYRDEVKRCLRLVAHEPALPAGVADKTRQLTRKLNEPDFLAEIDRVLAAKQP